MSDFLDNNSIGANNLNNIAIDLGKTTFSHFSDNTEYAVDELNSITSDILTAGVLASGNKCKVTLTSNSINVATGIIVFGSGAKIRNTEVKSFTYTSGSTVYIYAEHDSTQNTAALVCSETAPEGNNIIMLAQVADGIVTDRRTFAKAKVGLPGLNPYNQFDVRIDVETYDRSNWTLLHTFECDFDSFNFVHFKAHRLSNDNLWLIASSLPEDGYYCFVRDDNNVLLYQKKGSNYSDWFYDFTIL